MSPKRKGARSLRGRSIVALALIGFVIVSAAVIWRRGYGVTRAVELRQLDHQRMQLLAQRASLERRLHELTSRARLVAIAETRLGMRVPVDSQVIMLPAAQRATAVSGDHAAP